MSVRDSKDIVRDFLSAARQGDRASMADLLHPQVEIHEAGSLPFAGVHRGLEGFQALTRQVFTRFIDTQVSIERLFAQGDTVVVEMRLSYAELPRQSQARATLKAPMTDRPMLACQLRKTAAGRGPRRSCSSPSRC